MWLVVDTLTPLTSLLVWVNTIKAGETIGGYSKDQLITYYFLILIATFLFLPHIQGYVSEVIYKGSLNRYLTRPTSFVFEVLSIEVIYKICRLIFALPIIVVFILVFREEVFLDFNLMNLFIGVIGLFLGFSIVFVSEWIVGTAAFWIFKISSINRIYSALLYVFTGQIIPLSMFPSILKYFSVILPFKYIFSTPINVVLGLYNNGEIIKMFVIQLFWLVGLSIIAKFLWKRGLYKFEGVGI